MTSKLTRDIIQSEIADFFAGVVEIHTELGGPNTVEEAQNQLTERVLACVPAVGSEPVAFTSLRALETKNQIVAFTDDMSALDYGVANGWKDIVELYLHAQPAQVVMDEAQSRAAFEQWCTVNIERNKWHPEFYAHLPAREQWAAWEACRAAMLNGGKS